MTRQLKAPQATDSPYSTDAQKLPASLTQALVALQNDTVFNEGLGPTFINYFSRIKGSEITRHAESRENEKDHDEWQRREYFGRI